MKKISTLFKKDEKDLSRVINEVNPENSWVFDDNGNVIATRKFDGLACTIINGELYKRYDVRKGREIPEGAIECQKPDTKSGHHPHWVKCDKTNPADKYFIIGLDLLEDKSDGTYELMSELFQGRGSKKNPESIKGHFLVKHGSEVLNIKDLSFVGINEFLANPENDIEGIVFHHNDGRMCKIRKVDFKIDRHSK